MVKIYLLSYGFCILCAWLIFYVSGPHETIANHNTLTETVIVALLSVGAALSGFLSSLYFLRTIPIRLGKIFFFMLTVLFALWLIGTIYLLQGELRHTNNFKF